MYSHVLLQIELFAEPDPQPYLKGIETNYSDHEYQTNLDDNVATYPLICEQTQCILEEKYSKNSLSLTERVMVR